MGCRIIDVVLKVFKNFDWGLFLGMVLLGAYGILVIYSVAPAAAREQLVFFAFGLGFYFMILFVNYRFLRFLAWPLLVLILLTLLLTYFKGTISYGAARWLSFGGFSFQPSEVVKLVMIIVLANFFASSRFHPESLKVYLFSGILIMLPALLVFLQPDLGTALVLLAIGLGLGLVAGLPVRNFFWSLLTLIITMVPFWFFLKPYQQVRLATFLNPNQDPLGAGYNVIQSVIAVGSGGWWGRGFGRGTQSHLKFLPAHHTDFIFASLSEEWGFLGALLFLILAVFLLWRLLLIAQSAADNFGVFLVVGVFTMLFFQIMVNVGMNLGLLPITGIPLPLISSGGSSLLTTMVSLALVQSLALRRQI